MVEALVSRVETVVEPSAGNAAAVVRFIAVCEAIGQDEVDDFLFGSAVAKRLGRQG